ncbi:MAG: hypothetical protein IJA10_16030 [Lachnospiraceae bacterium]|nr:hypothetical protein [Lachnospiraceae bacterium]
MNIFKLQRYNWLKHMECIMENVNLKEISIVRNNHIIFKFLNSYNGDFYKNLVCKRIFKCCIDNEAFEDEDFSYFIADIYVKELSKDEVENSLKYYKYGYNVNFSQVNKLYLILIIGNEISLDIICEAFEIIENICN